MSKSPAEIKAIAYSIADEIETGAQPLIAAGMDRDKAVMLTVLEMGKKLVIVKG